ncbi:tyrosine-type recombinase/integrase [Runella sp.]|uniref:site-specific integrase n=1 Tax=Runella sp. TaxID=1960881 RepID=UPI0030191239
MAKVFFNYYLGDVHSSKPTPITLNVRYDAGTLRYPTGLTVIPKHWNGKVLAGDSSRMEKNATLSNIKTAAENVFRRFVNDTNRTPTREELRDLYNQTPEINPHPITEKKKLDLLGFIEQYLKDCETRIVDRTGTAMTQSTLFTYQNAFRALQEFKDKYYKKSKFDFENIDGAFYTQYRKFLTNDKQFATNTVGKHLRKVKTFLMEAQINGHLPNFNPRLFKSVEEKTDAIYLNDSELKHLFYLDLSKNTRLERVRDLFIVGARTGLRFSDYSNIQAKDIDLTNEEITITPKKTQDTIVIPLNDDVKAIMKRYEGKTPNSLPETLSNQKMNDYLKELGKLAGFEELIETSMTKGGKKITIQRPKYELMTTHAARRSFATNEYLACTSMELIRAITGHRTEKAFMKYIKLTPREKSDMLRQIWKQRKENAIEAPKEARIIKIA